MTSKDWCYKCSRDRSDTLKMAEEVMKYFHCYFVIIYQGMFLAVYFLTLKALLKSIWLHIPSLAIHCDVVG